LSYVQGNPTPIINHTIHNSKVEIGQPFKTHLVDELTAHSVWIKDVEYVDSKGEKKKCESLDEYFKLPLKQLTIAKHAITRHTCRFQPGECAIFG
jgi:hypothetical protein